MPESRKEPPSKYTADRKIPGAFEGETVSRRRFMTLLGAGLAAGSATALVAPSRVIEAAVSPPAKPAAAPLPPPKLRAEIEKQKKSTADTLKVIRDYKLALGSVMAFEFRPLGRKRGK